MVSLGAFFAFVLSTADRKLRVEEDPRVKGVEVDACIVGGIEVTGKVAKVLGKETKKTEKKTVAIVHCGIDDKPRQLTSKYQGIQTCAAANLIMQGGMACKYGCLGLGDCTTK